MPILVSSQFVREAPPWSCLHRYVFLASSADKSPPGCTHPAPLPLRFSGRREVPSRYRGVLHHPDRGDAYERGRPHLIKFYLVGCHDRSSRLKVGSVGGKGVDWRYRQSCVCVVACLRGCLCLAHCACSAYTTLRGIVCVGSVPNPTYRAVSLMHRPVISTEEMLKRALCFC